MTIIEKVFKYEETEPSVIKCKDNIWFRGETLAEVLGYSNTPEIVKWGFWCKLTLFYHFCGVPTQ